MDNQLYEQQPEQKSDANLDALIQEIGKGNVVPIVGTDLIRVKKDKKYELMEFILDKLEPKYDMSKFKYAENNAISPFEKINRIHAIATKDKLGFYTYIKDIMKEAEPHCETTSFDHLAKIRKFKLLINASFTNILQKSVELNRNAISNKLDIFSLNINRTPVEDIVIESSINSISPAGSPQKLKKTVVYNLYGKYEWRGENFIVVDDDILELVHYMSSNKDKLKTLYELLSSSSLLFIGCNFPDWLLRFFIRIFSKQKLSVSSSLYSVADILNSQVDRNRAIFIQNSSIKYFEFDGNAFINRLYNEIARVEPKWIRNNGNYIFLSYATENQAKVLEIYEDLEKTDLDVFMDIKKIDYGEKITEEVKKAIDNCKVFIPVISVETDNITNKTRYFLQEWDYVLQLHKENNPQNEKHKKPVIFPVFINTVRHNELKETTPKLFFDLKYQGTNAENGLSNSFLDALDKILE